MQFLRPFLTLPASYLHLQSRIKVKSARIFRMSLSLPQKKLSWKQHAKVFKNRSRRNSADPLHRLLCVLNEYCHVSVICLQVHELKGALSSMSNFMFQGGVINAEKDRASGEIISLLYVIQVNNQYQRTLPCIVASYH